MKLTKTNKLSFLLTCMFAFLLCICALFSMNTYNASAEAEENWNGITDVPDAELTMLSDEDEVVFWSNKTGATKVRYTANGSYTLNDATDIALRIKNADRQCNKPNTSGGLSYLRLKFKNSDTIWNIKNEQYILGSDGTTKLYTHFKTLAPDGTIKRTMGITNVGQFAFTANMDVTAYIPLDMIYNGNSKDAYACIMALDGYESLELEYIEFEVSTYRWDLILGDIALITTEDNATYDETVMDFTIEAQDTNCTVMPVIYDEVALKVNGVDGTVDTDGKVTATVDGVGSVSVASNKLRMFKSASLSSELSEGYGITSVITKVYNGDTLIDSVTANPLSEGYVLSGSYGFRINNPDNTEAIGMQIVKCVIEVVAAPLVKVNITGEIAGVTVAYGKVDNSETDHCVYLASGSASVLSITPQSGFTFAEAKLNGTTLTNIATEESVYTYEVTVMEEAELEIVGVGDPVDLTVEKAEGAKATVAIGDKTFAEANETYATNLRKTLTLVVAPDAGYAAKVEKVVPATEESGEATVTELVADENNAYKFTVEGAFTLRVTTSVVSYTVTYRLNNGAYAEGESNPETITVLDVVTLKTPTREDYNFLGWEIQGQEGYVTELKEISSDITVVAEWERKVVVEENSSSSTVEDSASASSDGNSSEESGCFSTVAGGVVALVSLCATVCFIKKKEN